MIEEKKDRAFPTTEDGANQYGLTKREYFAAKAMQGELAAQSESSGFYSDDAIADALDSLDAAVNKAVTRETIYREALRRIRDHAPTASLACMEAKRALEQAAAV